MFGFPVHVFCERSLHGNNIEIHNKKKSDLLEQVT